MANSILQIRSRLYGERERERERERGRERESESVCGTREKDRERGRERERERERTVLWASGLSFLALFQGDKGVPIPRHLIIF